MEPIFQGESLWPPMKVVTQEEFDALPDGEKIKGLYAILSNPSSNIFSSNIYSETDQIVGRWIDGRPIYSITVHGKTGASETWTDLITVPDIDIFIFAYGYANSPTQGTRPIPGLHHTFRLYGNGMIQTFVSNSAFSNQDIFLTILYVKNYDI